MPIPAHIRDMNRNEDIDLATLRNSPKAVLTRSEVARILEVDARTVSRAIEEGQIPCLRIGRRVMIPKDAFLKLFESGAA